LRYKTILATNNEGCFDFNRSVPARRASDFDLEKSSLLFEAGAATDAI
jgi:hypothetical protein